MKKYLGIFIIVISVVFAGCPVSIPHSLGIKNTEKFPEDLTGIWMQTDTTKEVMKMEIRKLDDYSIHVTILERGTLFMEEIDQFKGWFTEIKGKKFIYLQNETEIGSFYSYCYTFDQNELHTFDFSLLVGGTDVCVSTETYRAEVKASIENPKFLGEITKWRKL